MAQLEQQVRICFEIPGPAAVMTGTETAKLTPTHYAGVQDDESDSFNLFEVGAEGEPIGEPVGRIFAPEVAEQIRLMQQDT